MVLLLSLLSGAAQAEVFYIPSAGGETFQEIVDGASDGDTIIILPGEPSYYTNQGEIRAGWQPAETIYIDKDLTIEGVSPPSEISESDIDNDVYVEPNIGAILTTFAEGHQGVFVVSNEATLTLRNLYFKAPEIFCTDGKDNDGNGMVDASDPGCALDVPDTGFDTPAFPTNLRLVTVQAESALRIEDSWIQGFAGSFQGAVIKAQEAEIEISNSIFAFNEPIPTATQNGVVVEGQGGVLHLIDSEATITGSTFQGNRGSQGGVIWARGADRTLTLRDNVFATNWALDGGVVYGEVIDLVAQNNKFVDNKANLIIETLDAWMTHEGGALWLEDSRVQVNNNVFHLNQALDFGSAVYVRRNLTGSDIDFYHNTFIGNIAGVVGGGTLLFEQTNFSFWNNIVALTEGSAISAIDHPDLTAPYVEYNNFFANEYIFLGDLMTYPVSMTTNQVDDPEFQFVSGDVMGNAWDLQRYWTTTTSPVIDAGDPSSPPDPGGTLPDLGAYGGEDALTTDNDGDGWTSIHDCDDADPDVYPNAPEPCDDLDNDCNGLVDDNESLWYEDKDYDGYGDPLVPVIEACPEDTLPPISGGGIYVQNNDDCNDANARVSPGTPEYCDSIDNDCDGNIDEDIPATEQYPDRDGDGFGDPTATLEVVTLSCPPAGFSPFGTDCDDRNPDVYPLVELANLIHLPLADHPLESSEADRDLSYVADGIDQDCDAVDVCYADLDGDGFGAETLPNVPPQYVTDNDLNCANLSSLTATTATDCDDRDPLAYPGGQEITADGLDQNCDGRDNCWEDNDQDGYGSDQVVIDNDLDCDNDNARTSSRSGDCDDRPGDGADANPEKEEVCDGLDNDCNGEIDEISSPDALTYFLDNDGDGYGDVTQTLRACALPVGYAEIGGDCNDNEPRAYPQNQEVCDGIDNNCESGIDEDSAINVITWYEDLDGDGYGNPDFYQNACEEPEEGGPWIRAGKPLDCNDAEPTVGPCATGCSVTAPVSPRGPMHGILLLVGAMIARRRPRAQA